MPKEPLETGSLYIVLLMYSPQRCSVERSRRSSGRMGSIQATVAEYLHGVDGLDRGGVVAE
jgi:hypothetical protein